MPSRALDWFNQAVRDLEQAQDSQQAGGAMSGPTLPATVTLPSDLIDKARGLNNFYIPAAIPTAIP